MATQTFSSIVSKIALRRTTSNPVLAVTRRYAQSGSGSHTHQDAANAAKRGIDEAFRTGENLKNKTASTIEDIKIASNTKETAQSITEKAKQAAQGAWESAKETAQKTKETVLGKADEAKETVKETANHHTNTKNHPK